MKDIFKVLCTAVRALDEKKAEEIEVIDIAGVSSIGDYFVICSGSNPSHIQALIDNLEEKMEKNGSTLVKREGRHNGVWTLLDYGDVIIHIFDREGRQFYHLERLWNDGQKIEIASLLENAR